MTFDCCVGQATARSQGRMTGWYVCCRVFYAGYAFRSPPPCPECGKKSREASEKDVSKAEEAEKNRWHS